MPNILSLLQDYIRSRDVEVVDDVVRRYQEEILVSSKEEVRRQIMEAEKEESLSEEEADAIMEQYLKQL
jgi:hypothetical protein